MRAHFTVAALLAVAAIALGAPAQSKQPPKPKPCCVNNLKQIGLAIHTMPQPRYATPNAPAGGEVGMESLKVQHEGTSAQIRHRPFFIVDRTRTKSVLDDLPAAR